MKAIVTDNLTKKFGHLLAVDHISFEVEEEEIFGFLGANGAGKTSTVMMLATALNPSSGTAAVCEYDIIRERDKVRESMGIVFEDLSLDTNLTGRENLDFHATLYHLPRRVRDERIPRWKLTNEEWSKDSTRYSQSCQVMQVLGSQAVGKGASVNRN
jgi:ABC-2 type transport system ATP-binding protein